MKHQKPTGLLVRHGTLLDKLIRLIPSRVGFYEQVRIGSDLNHSRFTLKKPATTPNTSVKEKS